MKKILIILLMFPVFGFGQLITEGKTIQFDLKDTSFYYYSTNYGVIDYFVETDTVYGTTKNATVEFLQSPYDFRGVRIDGGFITLSDTLNGSRLIKGHLPNGGIVNQVKFTKNSVDSAVVRLKVFVTRLR